jgi:sugar/nucleoside kinase (ribokinase family)
MGKGIALAGHICVDYVKRIDVYPTSGMLGTILSVSRSTGGAVPNTGVALKRIDPELEVLAAGLVGEDDNGSYVLGVLASCGIDITRVGRSAQPTSFTDVMTDARTNERTFFAMRGATAEFGIDHIDFDSFGACSIFHIAYALMLDSMDRPDAVYGTVMARALCEASRRGLLTSMDVVSTQDGRFAAVVTPSLKHCDYFIVNEIESSMICGIPSRDGSGRIIAGNMAPICRALLDMGVRRLAAVHAPEGGWCMEKGGEPIFRPSLRLPEGYIKGTVGAGDAFCAGMLHALNRGESAGRALDIAAGAAACALGGGGAFGVKPLSEIQGMLDAMPRRDPL